MFRDLSPTTFSGETVNKSQQIATITLAAAKKMAQAVVDLDLEEFKIFQMAWQSASQVTLPKSGKSSSSTRKKRKQSKRR